MEAREPLNGEEAFLQWAGEVERRLAEMRAILEIVGRAAIGSNLLLAHWMARSGGSGATEEDLAEALAVAASAEWSARLSAAGLDAQQQREPGENQAPVPEEVRS